MMRTRSNKGLAVGMEYWFLGAGLLLLALGCEAIIRGGVAIARRLNVAPLFIGVLVIGLGSAAPVLAVALRANLASSPDLALGTVVGSNIIMILLVLGLGALIRPLSSPPKVVLRDGGVLLAASVALALIGWGHVITRREAAFLAAGLAFYLVLVLVTEWRRPAEHSVACGRAAVMHEGRATSTTAGFFILIFGLVCVALGAHFAVGGAMRAAEALHVSQPVAALTALALGTSAPQLLHTAIAAVRAQTDLVVGSLLGMSAINVLGVIGLTALVRPITISAQLASIDILVMLGSAAILLPMLSTKWRLSRPQGALLLVCYVAYAGFLAWREGLIPAAGIG